MLCICAIKWMRNKENEQIAENENKININNQQENWNVRIKQKTNMKNCFQCERNLVFERNQWCIEHSDEEKRNTCEKEEVENMLFISL